MSSLLIIDKFLRSVLSISPSSNSADALVSWFCDNSPQSVYKLAKSARERTLSSFGRFAKSNFSCGGSINHDHNV